MVVQYLLHWRKLFSDSTGRGFSCSGTSEEHFCSTVGCKRIFIPIATKGDGEKDTWQRGVIQDIVTRLENAFDSKKDVLYSMCWEMTSSRLYKIMSQIIRISPRKLDYYWKMPPTWWNVRKLYTVYTVHIDFEFIKRYVAHNGNAPFKTVRKHESNHIHFNYKKCSQSILQNSAKVHNICKKKHILEGQKSE